MGVRGSYRFAGKLEDECFIFRSEGVKTASRLI